MAINKSSGQEISFNDIKTEFGAARDTSLTPNQGFSFGKYRVSQTAGSLTLPLDSGIPSSGEIKFSQFYGKRLNIVVVCGGGNLGSANYSGSSVIIGSANNIIKSLPGSASGKRVYINITGQYTSHGASSSSWAFSTGNNWAGAIVSVDQGGGSVYGAGGQGGNASGGNGGNGSNGMRVWSQATNNMQAVYAGGGGGGAGAWAEQNDWGDKNDAQGGGGGGGNGIPGGNGGSGHRSGQAGGATIGGNGGHGRDDGEAKGGQGGNGGSYGGNGQGASGGVNKRDGNGSGGQGGQKYGYY